MKKISLIFSIFSIFLFAACERNGDMYTYDDWDFDNDGLVNEADFDNGIGEYGIFGDWDGDTDGMLDENEWVTGRDTYYSDYDGAFTDWDLDDNNYLDENEFSDGVFGFMDADNDGNITELEYNDVYADI